MRLHVANQIGGNWAQWRSLCSPLSVNKVRRWARASEISHDFWWNCSATNPIHRLSIRALIDGRHKRPNRDLVPQRADLRPNDRGPGADGGNLVRRATRDVSRYGS